MSAKIKKINNGYNNGIWGSNVPEVAKSLMAILLTMLSIYCVWYFLIPSGNVEWYIPICSAVLLMVADGSKPMLHPLTRILTTFTAVFYLFAAVLIFFHSNTSYIAGILFAVIAIIIFLINAYEKNVFGPPGQ